MGRYTGPSCRLCRRSGEKLFLKGDKCFTPRCAFEKRRNPPGDVSRRRRRPTDYAVHLLEKQKAKYIYGVLEGQFRRYMTEAFNTPGVTGMNLLRTLERRLDNVVFQLGFADSRKQARQIVLHGHFRVNGAKTDIPSYLVKPGDHISWKESDKGDRFLRGAHRWRAQTARTRLDESRPRRDDRHCCVTARRRRPSSNRRFTSNRRVLLEVICPCWTP